jgi:hypothetical protein
MSNFAASRKVNPEGSSVKLTAEQVWKGLQIKARDPAKFIPDTTSVNTISDAEDKVCRTPYSFMMHWSHSGTTLRS